MSEPLKLFWWRDKPNFGDAINPFIVNHVSGREVIWAKPAQADLFALGSILQIVRRTHRAPRSDGSRPWIWGSGCMGSLRMDFKGNVNFAMVRGPITGSILNVPGPRFGDPGLLISEAMGEEIEQGDRIGLVPHHSQLDDPQIAEIVKAEPALKLIDVRNDALSVCREIASCAHIASSSLHGLIVADSFGVQNTWLNPDGIHKSPAFKFYDYAASVQRPMQPPIALNELPKKIGQLSQSPLNYLDGIAQSKEHLQSGFPAELKNT